MSKETSTRIIIHSLKILCYPHLYGHPCTFSCLHLFFPFTLLDQNSTFVPVIQFVQNSNCFTEGLSETTTALKGNIHFMHYSSQLWRRNASEASLSSQAFTRANCFRQKIRWLGQSVEPRTHPVCGPLGKLYTSNCCWPW